MEPDLEQRDLDNQEEVTEFKEDFEKCELHSFEYIHEGINIKYFKCRKCGLKDDLPF